MSVSKSRIGHQHAHKISPSRKKFCVVGTKPPAARFLGDSQSQVKKVLRKRYTEIQAELNRSGGHEILSFSEPGCVSALFPDVAGSWPHLMTS